MTKLRGAHVIITGGSQGIGAAFAREAHDAGARVSLIARRPEVLAEAAAVAGPDVRWRAADVTEPHSLNVALDELAAESGPCDILLCCAGTALPGRFLEVPPEEFRQQWGLNVGGAVAAVQHVLPGMTTRGRGHIVLVSSTAGVIGVPGYTGYGATKYAIRGFADALRYEVEPAGVRVSVLYPPDTQTPGFAAENLRKPALGGSWGFGFPGERHAVVRAALLKRITDV